MKLQSPYVPVAEGWRQAQAFQCPHIKLHFDNRINFFVTPANELL